MKIAVAPNLQKKDAEACAREATGILEACGWEVVQACGLYQEGLRRRAAEEALADCQILLAIGGDGTIIHAAKAAAAWDIPILGVNAGKLGFTAGLEREELAMLSRLTEPDLPEERRMMLHVTLTGPQSSQSFLALNDAVVSAELAAIIDGVELSDKVGVCLDTCHVWDGGYDIAEHLDEVLNHFDREVGLERLKAIHLNDSQNPLGAHKDRHAKIGHGFIGLEAMARIINHPALKHLPLYLETPNELDGYAQEIKLLREHAR